MEKKVRVRFAPSPTGQLHIGGARTALFNYLFARKMNGTYVLRIEDTDQKRNVSDAEEKFLENFKWLGLFWDEGPEVGGAYAPYRCTDRIEIYQAYIQTLLETNKAYRCFCDEETLENVRNDQKQNKQKMQYNGTCTHLGADQIQENMNKGIPYTVRLAVDPQGEIQINDIIRGSVKFARKEIGDFVIVKSDGVPVYNFAVAVDDALMQISHVIRGEEHLSNTPRQIVIYEALGLEIPLFAHVPLILNDKGEKLSKRDESILQFIDQYRSLGYLPEAILNFLVLLGWSPGGQEEYFSIDQLIELFSLKRINKSGAVFDVKKLAKMNATYIKNSPIEKIVELSKPFFEAAGYPISDEVWFTKLITLLCPSVTCLSELPAKASFAFEKQPKATEETCLFLQGDFVANVIATSVDIFSKVDEWSAENIKEAVSLIQELTSEKGKNLMGTIRGKITGHLHGPELPASLELIGKEATIKQLKNT
jgi:nondiscriminating glutamyl-tRNA synthetase